MAAIIPRDSYIEKIVRTMGNGEVKVITGVRRCGKSVLLFELFFAYLLANGTDADHIIKIALDQRRHWRFRNPIALCEHVERIVGTHTHEQFFLFVDEVQLTEKVKDREHGDIEVSIYDMLNELAAYKNLDVYVTGSNSKGLSRDIATEFRGRATQIRVSPLSFAEYFAQAEGSEQDALDDYLLFGGMPRTLAFTDERDKKNYLSSLFDELYITDIVERGGIEREDVLADILDFLASQVGSLTNPNKVASALSAAKREKVNPALAQSYIQLAEDAFLVSCARRFDVKGKSYFRFPNKYYYTDLGLRNARLNFRQYDPGHLMENLIYNELVGRGYSVDVGVIADRRGGKNVQREIDFVVNDADRRLYIQSALRMDTEDKETAELASLSLAKDFFKKVVIRRDIPSSFYDEQGVFHCKLTDFLLGRVELA